MLTLVNKTFADSDKNLDGYIDLEEYRLLVSNQPAMMTNMTVNVSQRIMEEENRMKSMAKDDVEMK